MSSARFNPPSRESPGASEHSCAFSLRPRRYTPSGAPCQDQAAPDRDLGNPQRVLLVNHTIICLHSLITMTLQFSIRKSLLNRYLE